MPDSNASDDTQPLNDTQQIDQADLETLPPLTEEPDAGGPVGTPESPATADAFPVPGTPSDDAEAAYVDPFEAMAEDPIEPEPGAKESAGKTESVATDAAAAPATSQRPAWLPAEIDPSGLSEPELLRLRIVHAAGRETTQLDTEEQQLVERYRQHRQQLQGQPTTPQAQPYQPIAVDVPKGYEEDQAIGGLVGNFNRQNTETAHLINQQQQAIATLGQQIQQVAQQSAGQANVAAWATFQQEHPEAKDTEVQEKIRQTIAFWQNPDNTNQQFWAAALQQVTPTEPVTPPEANQTGRQARARRALNAAAVNTPNSARKTTRRESGYDDLHQANATFGDFLRRTLSK